MKNFLLSLTIVGTSFLSSCEKKEEVKPTRYRVDVKRVISPTSPILSGDYAVTIYNDTKDNISYRVAYLLANGGQPTYPAIPSSYFSSGSSDALVKGSDSRVLVFKGDAQSITFFTAKKITILFQDAAPFNLYTADDTALEVQLQDGYNAETR